MQELRDNQEGRARYWYAGDEPSQTRDELLKATKGRIVWSKCYGCEAYVIDEDFTQITGEGKVCIDCYKVKNQFKLDVGTKNALESWCEKESDAHAIALLNVADESDLSCEVIDYLIFRMPKSYADTHPIMSELAANLDDVYQRYVKEAFDELLDKTLDEEVKEAVERDKPRGTEDERKPFPVTEKCAECGKFKVIGHACIACTNAEKARQKERTTLPTAALETCWCGEKAQVQLGRLAGYCQTHFDSCNIDDCVFSPHVAGKRVEGPGKANHLRTDGKRVCHFHARGEKGVWSDTKLKGYGVEVRSLVGEPGGL